MVTLDTVKKHVSHILGKLSGSNRTEAVMPFLLAAVDRATLAG